MKRDAACPSCTPTARSAGLREWHAESVYVFVAGEERRASGSPNEGFQGMACSGTRDDHVLLGMGCLAPRAEPFNVTVSQLPTLRGTLTRERTARTCAHNTQSHARGWTHGKPKTCFTKHEQANSLTCVFNTDSQSETKNKTWEASTLTGVLREQQEEINTICQSHQRVVV